MHSAIRVLKLAAIESTATGEGEPDSVHGFDLLPQHHHGLLISRVVRQRQEDFVASLWLKIPEVLHAISTDASGEVHVLLHDSHSLRMDRAQVGVFEETHNVGFSGLLESLQGLRLEAETVVHVHCDGAHETLEGGTRQEHVDRLLVPLDFTQSDSSRLEPVLALIFHATFSRSSFLDSLGALDLVGHLVGGFGFGSNFGLGHSDCEFEI